jgi:hypothetical protein
MTGELVTVEADPVRRLQAAMAQMPQFDGFKTAHHFAEGLYGRAVWRPKNAVVVGALHRHSHFTFLLSGRMRISNGETWDEHVAPAFFVTPAGTKRVTHALEDSVLMTVHRLDPDTRDADQIMEQLIEPEDLPSLFDFDNKYKNPALAARPEQLVLEF